LARAIATSPLSSGCAWKRLRLGRISSKSAVMGERDLARPRPSAADQRGMLAE
jgi:hypothetical protein